MSTLYTPIILIILTTNPCMGIIEHSARIAQCRALCLDKFTDMKQLGETLSVCKTNRDCSMCWDTCQMLMENFAIWSPMCGNTIICFPGCQQACEFHTGGRGERAVSIEPPGKFPQHLQIQRVGTKNILVRWKSPEPTTKFVYVLLKSNNKAEKWQEIIQTTEFLTTVRSLTPGLTTNFKILAVTSKGIYATEEISATLKPPMSQNGDENTKSAPLINKQISPNQWDVKVSLYQTSNTMNRIEATISWEPPKPSEFVLVWETIDGSVQETSHIYTETTTARITLEKNRVYRLHIQLLSSDLKSEYVEIYTGQMNSRHNTYVKNTLDSDCLFRAILLGVSCFTLFILLLSLGFLGCRIFNSHDSDNKKRNETPLQLNDEDATCPHRSAISRPNIGAIIESLEILSNSLSPTFSNVVNNPGATPPPYEVHDTNPASPQFGVRCLSENVVNSPNTKSVFSFESNVK